MVFYIFTLKKAENILKEVFARLIQQSSRVELGKKFESGFYAKPDTPSPQAVPAAGEPTISMTALLELLKDADPEMKAKRNRQISRRIKKHLWLSNRSWARDVHSFGILHSWGALAGKSCSAQASSIWLIAGAFRRTQSK